MTYCKDKTRIDKVSFFDEIEIFKRGGNKTILSSHLYKEILFFIEKLNKYGA